MDNVFAIAMIFTYFAIPRMYRHRVLFWSILGGIVLRGIMIGLGATLVAQHHRVRRIFAVIHRCHDLKHARAVLLFRIGSKIFIADQARPAG